jgi:hypothetical protein
MLTLFSAEDTTFEPWHVRAKITILRNFQCCECGGMKWYSRKMFCGKCRTKHARAAMYRQLPG